jgi:hypothetical protein
MDSNAITSTTLGTPYDPHGLPGSSPSPTGIRKILASAPFASGSAFAGLFAGPFTLFGCDRGFDCRAIGGDKKKAQPDIPADRVLLRLLEGWRYHIKFSLNARDPMARAEARRDTTNLSHDRTAQADFDRAFLGKKNLRKCPTTRFILCAQLGLDLLTVPIANGFLHASFLEFGKPSSTSAFHLLGVPNPSRKGRACGASGGQMPCFKPHDSARHAQGRMGRCRITGDPQSG